MSEAVQTVILESMVMAGFSIAAVVGSIRTSQRQFVSTPTVLGYAL
jgi:hypothetical protein